MEKMNELLQTTFFELHETNGEWEPFIEGGEIAGQVKWLRQTQEPSVVFAGLWKHSPSEHPEGMPYAVHGNETFIVLEGEAELILPDGEIKVLKSGSCYSFAAGFNATWKTTKSFVKFFVVS